MKAKTKVKKVQTPIKRESIGDGRRVGIVFQRSLYSKALLKSKSRNMGFNLYIRTLVENDLAA